MPSSSVERIFLFSKHMSVYMHFLCSLIAFNFIVVAFMHKGKIAFLI